jgi:AraC-like DNA-binding protein
MLVDVRQPVTQTHSARGRIRSTSEQELAYVEEKGRAGTLTARRVAIERVITVMRERLHEPLSLCDMADIALLSPYHFNRVFRNITGVPPQKFQAALRMKTAKRLLLTTQISVTDVCFEVGYSSLSSFIRHFTDYVGVPPRQLRRLVEAPRDSLLPASGDDTQNLRQHGTSAGKLMGSVRSEVDTPGLIFVGIFETPIPQGHPVGCTFLTMPGDYCISQIPDGCYHIFATVVQCLKDPLSYLLPDDDTLRVGAGIEPLLVQAGQVSGSADLTLRRIQLTDPPVLMVLPFLHNEQSHSRHKLPLTDACMESAGCPAASSRRSTTDEWKDAM